MISVNIYERNPLARRIWIHFYGYTCFVCGLNSDNIYGKLGKGYIHVHHLKPLNEIRKEYIINPIADLMPICPNCHVMVHRKSSPYSIEEVKSAILMQDKLKKG